MPDTQLPIAFHLRAKLGPWFGLLVKCVGPAELIEPRNLLRAVKNGRYGPDSDRSRGGPCRDAIRPLETFRASEVPKESPNFNVLVSVDRGSFHKFYERVRSARRARRKKLPLCHS